MNYSWGFIDGVVKSVARRVSFAPTRYSAGGVSLRSALAQTGAALDYENAVGDVLSNSVVAACVNAICQALPEAPILLEKRVGGNEYERIDSHPVLDLLHNPNPYLSEAELWGVTTAFERTRGEAFWYFEYGPERTVPREIWFRAPEYVQVQSDTSRFISGYNITSESGQVVALDEGDVVHFRHQLSTVNPRAGWSPIQTGKRQIVGDNGAATYHSAILRNAGAASLIISLKDAAAAGEVTPGQIDEYVQLFKRKVVGEGSGAILGMDLPLDVHKVGFSPDEMALDKLLEYYESRLCALTGVNRRVINLGNDPTYENSKVALTDFWERTIVPMRRRHASTLSSQLLPLFGLDPAVYRLRFDFSEVEALRENVDALHARWRSTFEAGGIDLFTFQEKIGLKPDESYRGRYAKLSSPLEEGQSNDEIKAGYNANQPRDSNGRWTNGGGSVLKPLRIGEDKVSGQVTGNQSASERVSNESSGKSITFRNLDEAVKWAAANGIQVNYGKPNEYENALAMAQRVSRAISDAKDNGLEPPSSIIFDHRAFADDKTSPAESIPTQGVLTLNPKANYWKSAKKAKETCQKQYAVDYWSTAHADHPVRHEIGHLNRKGGGGVLSSKDKALIEDKVSRRAAENVDEFVAEMVAKLWDDSNAELEVGEEVMNLFRGYGGPDVNKLNRGKKDAN